MHSRFRQFRRGIDPNEAAVVEYVIDRNALGVLDTLAFILPDGDWAEFVKNCRSDTYDHKGPGAFYELVYGPVATIAQETARDYEQLSFHSTSGIGVLQFVQIHRGGPRFA